MDDAGVAVVDHINTAIPFEDKPWLGVDRAAASPHRGNVYVAWTRFDVYGSANPAHRSHIMFSRSRDGGAHVLDAASRSPTTPATRGTATAPSRASVPVGGPNGDVLHRVGRPEGHRVRQVDRRRLDVRARTCSSSAMPGGWDLPVPGLERHNGMPVTAVDLSEGARKGTIYVNWIDERNGDLDVFVAASTR